MRRVHPSDLLAPLVSPLVFPCIPDNWYFTSQFSCTKSAKRWPFVFGWPLLLYTWIFLIPLTLWKQSRPQSISLCGEKLKVCGRNPSSWLQFSRIWASISPCTVVGISPLLEDKVCTVGRDGKPDVFVRKGKWSKPSHLRGLCSHSPQGSIFEVSGIRGPCFSSFYLSYHVPFPVAVDQCISLEADTVQQTVYPILCSCSSPCLSCYKCFRCYYLISPKFCSCPWKQKIPHLGFRPKETSHFQGKGSSPLFLPIHGTASAEEIPIAATLVSARGNLATVPVLQNLREMVVALSLPSNVTVSIPSLQQLI